MQGVFVFTLVCHATRHTKGCMHTKVTQEVVSKVTDTTSC